MKTFFFLILSAIILSLASCSEDDCSVNNTEYPEMLDKAVSSVYSELNILNGINSLGANSIASTDLTGESVYPILENILETHKMIDESLFIDADGVMQFVKPDKYKVVEGTDISEQAHVIKLHQTKQPVMSALFPAVEGFMAIDFAYPIIQNTELVGSLSFLFEPNFMFGHILEPLLANSDNEIFIAQSDGTVIYDQDIEEIGKNITSDPSYMQYPGLVDTGKKIIQTKEGYTTYSYLKAETNEKISKKAYWKTIEFFGAEWRVVIAIPN